MSEEEDEILDGFGFDMPTDPPQFSGNSDAKKTITELLQEAPTWDPAWSPELLILARQHQIIRSFIGLAAELGKEKELLLREADEPKDIYRLQGEVRAFNSFSYIVINSLVNADEATRPSGEEEKDENSSATSVP